ncbi:hypothetical protein AAHS21_23685 [Mycobacterium sp. 050272]|uniref:hypothetical protein n=1 Tax=Mycobacterium sp. 050272 TaxID=3142488 RepID=UPI003184B64E
MTTPTTDTGDDARRVAIEQYLADMSAADFRALVYRVRPPGETSPLSTDPAARMRAMTASIAAKQQLRPRVDNQGHPLKGPAE